MKKRTTLPQVIAIIGLIIAAALLTVWKTNGLAPLVYGGAMGVVGLLIVVLLVQIASIHAPSRRKHR